MHKVMHVSLIGKQRSNCLGNKSDLQDGEGRGDGRREQEGVHTMYIAYLYKHVLMKYSIMYNEHTEIIKKEVQSPVISITF